ncbi:nuclear transport factor 2 family protein [Halomarina litorea]|uniref:nuclear transport factor 2 family protein n=1 Tax=Halomarina litorea TaxID=2961595 RepID=UPI0020C1FEF1|nr:nuclear transport factor 2 family protein [Halomarina sp. BCD28]
MTSTESVLDHHLRAFGAQDMEENLKDYDEDSVLITHDSVFRGIDEITGAFEAFFEEFDDPETELTVDRKVIEGDVAYITWHARTPENDYEFATDTFLVRDGTIEVQTLGAVVSPRE